MTTELTQAFKQIRLRKQEEEAALQIQKKYLLHPVSARVLAARKHVPSEELENYLDPTLQKGLPQPSLLLNLEKAAELIAEVVAADGSIAICCDFDVDGLSGGAQMQAFFEDVGVKSEVFVPNRFTDGYGLNEGMVRQAADNGHKLLLTIDYGTTNVHEVEVAQSLGMKAIVVDHHHVITPPPADVFVNPQQEGCGFAGGILCAAGLAWYLITALRKTLPQAKEIDPRLYLDLACLGTICDMVPLVGANRVIAKKGLELLGRTRRRGLVALKDVIGIRDKVGCSNVSFGIGPRLNAAGRMVDGALVIKLLTTDAGKGAAQIARKLNRLNIERQDTEALIKELAINQLKERGELPAGIAVWGDDFHTGVIGIVAQRMVETYYRPAAVMGLDGEAYKGSVRGIVGFNVVEALTEVGDMLLKFGGHEGAGGFAIAKEKVHDFAAEWERICARRIKDLEVIPTVKADTVTTIAELSVALVNELQGFEPFGIGNPGPVLLLEGLQVVETKTLKHAHLKVVFTDGERYLTGLMWRVTEHPALNAGSKVNVAFRPDINSFQGKNEIQAVIQAAEIA